MTSQSNTYSLTRSFNLLRHLFLVLGVYPLYPNPLKSRYGRNLLRVYCYYLTFIDIFSSIFFLHCSMIFLYQAFFMRNVDFIAMLLGEIHIFIAAVIQKVLYYRKKQTLVEFFKEWENFETEYEKLTGKQLKTLDLKKVSLVALITSVCIILTIATYQLDLDYGERISSIALTFYLMLFYIIHYLTRFYTEIIWNMMAIALKNTARQLMNDYASEECANPTKEEEGDHANDNIRRKKGCSSVSTKQHYRYLWMKLTILQYKFSTVFSTIYFFQITFNFLQVLFTGFGWTGAIYRYIAFENLTSEEVLQLLGMYVETGQCFVYIMVGSTTADTAQRAMNNEIKEKLLEIIARKKHENLPDEEEKEFLKTVSKTKTGIKLDGYGKIDRNFFCKVMLAWVNYTIILLQFRNLIIDTSHDDPDMKPGISLDWGI